MSRGVPCRTFRGSILFFFNDTIIIVKRDRFICRSEKKVVILGKISFKYIKTLIIH